MSSDALVSRLESLQGRALRVGIIALGLCVVWAIAGRDPGQFFRSYLLGFVFWIGITLGSIAIVMLHHLVGGGWGYVIRRLLESASRTTRVMALLAVPLLAGIPVLYEWSHREVVAADRLLDHKHAYLNVPFFVFRTILYFTVWLALAHHLNKWSAEQDRNPTTAIKRRLQLLSAPGLVLYGLTVTFAAVDWVMSLEPHWFSTIYGALFMIGQALLTLAFAVTVAVLLSRYEPMSFQLRPEHLHDVGNLMLAFVMLWAYMSFSQFLIIWAGNLPEEISWYLARLRGGWQWIAIALVVFHFALPFVLLLLRDVKRRTGLLVGVAAAMIVVRLVDLYWVIEPAFHRGRFLLHWLDVAAPVGIGGLWLAAYARELRGRPLLPVEGALEADINHG